MAKKKAKPKSRVPSTASLAAAYLVRSGNGFLIPTAAQKRNILVALAKNNKVVYGRAYDIVKILGKVDLSDPDDVENNINRILIYEIKSTRRADVDKTFENYFFALTTAELLVAQSLKEQFKFVFVHAKKKMHIELSLKQVFQRAHGIYPSWSISF